MIVVDELLKELGCANFMQNRRKQLGAAACGIAIA